MHEGFGLLSPDRVVKQEDAVFVGGFIILKGHKMICIAFSVYQILLLLKNIVSVLKAVFFRVTFLFLNNSI